MYVGRRDIVWLLIWQFLVTVMADDHGNIGHDWTLWTTRHSTHACHPAQSQWPHHLPPPLLLSSSSSYSSFFYSGHITPPFRYTLFHLRHCSSLPLPPPFLVCPLVRAHAIPIISLSVCSSPWLPVSFFILLDDHITSPTTYLLPCFFVSFVLGLTVRVFVCLYVWVSVHLYWLQYAVVGAMGDHLILAY